MQLKLRRCAANPFLTNSCVHECMYSKGVVSLSKGALIFVNITSKKFKNFMISYNVISV